MPDNRNRASYTVASGTMSEPAALVTKGIWQSPMLRKSGFPTPKAKTNIREPLAKQWATGFGYATESDRSLVPFPDRSVII